MVISRFARTILKKALPALLIAVLVAGSLGADADARTRHKKTAPKENPRYAALVMDADTGQILYQNNADKSLHPASLTKIMTLLMVFEALDQGKIRLSDRITVSRRASEMAPTKLGLAPGSGIKVQDAIYALVTQSANDVSAAIAEHLGGTESNFARQMTARARDLGMTRTTFVNASGLNDPRQYSSARDMSKLARYVIGTYPDYYRYFSTDNFYYRGKNYHNHNGLMKSYQGMDGMKTGYVGASGFNLVASAVRGNHRLIGVVFGGRSAKSRNDHMASLLDAGFVKIRSMPTTTLVADAQPVQQQPQSHLPSLISPAMAAVEAPPVQIASAAPVATDPAPSPSRKPALLVAAATLNNMAPAAAEMTRNATLPNLLGTAPGIQQASLTMPSATNDATLGGPSWAIQVGAYASRAATDKALHDSMKKLPVKFASLSPMIAPLKTQGGWLFRARLHGLSETEAFNACKYLSECVPVAPKTN